MWKGRLDISRLKNHQGDLPLANQPNLFLILIVIFEFVIKKIEIILTSTLVCTQFYKCLSTPNTESLPQVIWYHFCADYYHYFILNISINFYIYFWLGFALFTWEVQNADMQISSFFYLILTKWKCYAIGLLLAQFLFA